MRSDARRIRAGVLAGAVLLLAGAALAQPASLSRAFTVEDLRESIQPTYIKERQIAPLETWRQQAVASILDLEHAVPADDFRVVKSGMRYRLQGNRLVEDYLGALSDARVEAVFAYGTANERKSYANAITRIEIAGQVLNREGLTARHSEARYQKAALSIVITQDRDAVLAGFASVREASGREDEHGRRAAAAIGALQGPATAEDFAASLDLMEIANKMDGRLQMSWMTSPMIAQFRSEGFAPFVPQRFEGSGVPMLALARAAFDKNEFAILDAAEENLAAVQSSDAQSAVRIRYWIGMGDQSAGRYEDALGHFEGAVALGTGDIYEAWAMLRAGECKDLLGDPLEAAVNYLEIQDLYPQYPEVVVHANEFFGFLSKHSLMDEEAAAAKYDIRRMARQTAMNKGGN